MSTPLNAMSTPKAAGSDKLAIQRQLRIKVGATRRLLKEHTLYRNEAEEHRRKAELVAENGEEWDIKNARRILDESQRMIRDTADRLEKAAQDLKTLVDSVKSRPEFSEDEVLLEAERELTEASVPLNNAS